MGSLMFIESADPTVSASMELGADSREMLPTLLDQSLDCIKLIAADGTVQHMNRNGLCAMEVDDFQALAGRPWVDLWPEEAKTSIQQALRDAGEGKKVRFDAFCPTAKGTPRWWDVAVSQVVDQGGRPIGFLSVSRDVTEARLAREVAEIASAEMRHRLKNSYAMISGLLTALARGIPEREEFVREIRDRLSALGVAQTLFVAREHAPCDVRVLVPALLQPFSLQSCPIEIPELPDVSIDQGQADALALVFGEFAVNSSKHGALTANGSIKIRAELDDEHLTIVWSERSAQRVNAHERAEGQGLKLITRILSARNGNVQVDWKDYGLDATINLRRLPAR